MSRGGTFSLQRWCALVLAKIRGDVPAPSSHAYRSGQTKVVCAALRMDDGRYCGNFVAIVASPDGHLDVHERTCARWDLTHEDALIRARAIAEAIYPPTLDINQQSQPQTDPVDHPDGGA